MSIIRRTKNASNGLNGGDLDTAFYMFRCGMIYDGNLPSKDSRNYFREQGYAVSYDGMTCLTGRGVVALLTNRHALWYAWRVWRRERRNPFFATARELSRARD